MMNSPWAICDTTAFGVQTFVNETDSHPKSPPSAASIQSNAPKRPRLTRVDSAQATKPDEPVTTAVSLLHEVSAKPQKRFFSPTKSFLTRTRSRQSSATTCEKSIKSASSPTKSQEVVSRTRKRKSASPSGEHGKSGGSAKDRSNRVISGGIRKRRSSGTYRTLGSRRIARVVEKGKTWLLRSRG